MKKYSRGLVWLRRDLRLQDNRAVSRATHECDEVVPVFVFDRKILDKLGNREDKRITFLHETLAELDEELQEMESSLVVRQGDPVEEIPAVLQALDCDVLYFNEDYEPYAKQRDPKVCERIQKEGAKVFSFKDHVIFSGAQVLKSDGDPYQVFTPYKNTWLKKAEAKDFEAEKFKKNFVSRQKAKKVSQSPTLKDLGFEKAELPLDFQKPGRKQALKRLKAFAKKMSQYQDERDFPALEMGTSGLSVHLRFGTLSIRECFRECRSQNSKGARVWQSELIWRDFYQMILDQYPHVAKKAFKEKYASIKWKGSKSHFEAWCEGRTGFPIVDAGMRQLNETGWMHNRVRMITACFLVKDLLVDWKKGEAYFAEKLLDFDLASNNGGWQWSASTGCDAQPYFRIFNPSSQSERFDKDGEYIKEWIPELKDAEVKDLHKPESARLDWGTEYPAPIIVHSEQRDKALALFKGAKDGK